MKNFRIKKRNGVVPRVEEREIVPTHPPASRRMRLRSFEMCPVRQIALT
jgi:hypothetical protein